MIGCWEGEVHYCCLKSYGIFYCSNVWWDHVPDANCTGVKGEHCSVDAAPGGDVMPAGVLALLALSLGNPSVQGQASACPGPWGCAKPVDLIVC